jgi:hypothetical protein
MTLKKELPMITLTCAILFISLLTWTMGPAPVAEAGLPPRSTPSPAPSRDKGKDKDDGGPIGAWLELQAADALAGEWSEVQWQNSAGAWENVDGWQGSLDEAGRCRWWVAAQDFGSGPFRWVVTRGKGGPVLGTSGPFHLPASANQVLQVEVAPAKN